MFSRTALALALLLFPLEAFATPLKLPGFPVKLGGSSPYAPAIADLDGDGSGEIVVVHGQELSVVGHDGKLKAGFPVALEALSGQAQTFVSGAPALGDVDGDGQLEIALAVSIGTQGQGALLLVTGTGELRGEPFALRRSAGVGPSLLDVDGDGKAELVVGTKAGELVVLRADGRPLPGFPLNMGSEVTSPVSFGALAEGRPGVLAFGTSDGRLHAVDIHAKVREGFPLQTRFAISGAPAFGDIDDDGENELVVSSQDFSVYAVNADATLLPKFPVSAGYRLYGGPALADIDRDGRLDIVVAAGDGQLAVWNSLGASLPGFPQRIGGRPAASVVVADADRDGSEEIFATVDGALYGFSSKGKALAGFPLRPGRPVEAPLAVVNLVPDPSLELIALTADGELHGWRLKKTGSLVPGPLAWGQQSHDAARQGRYGPNPARYRDVKVSPPTPRAGEALSLSYRHTDLDGEPEPKTLVRWTLDGRHEPALDGARTVPAERVKRGGVWVAEVQAPEDHALFGVGAKALITRSAPVKILNTPPPAPRIELPAEIRTGDALSARVLSQPPDVDGDAVSHRSEWWRDGARIFEGAVLPPGTTRKHEQWTLRLIPHDGHEAGEPVELSFEVLNTPPAAPMVKAPSSEPTVVSGWTLALEKAPTDADGDELKVEYAFFIGKERLPLPPRSGHLPGVLLRRGDKVRAQVRALDDESAGPLVELETSVVNSPPSSPNISIAPRTPKTGEPLQLLIDAPALDPDMDQVRYQVKWNRGGFTTPGIPAGQTRRGESWSVQVSACDDQLCSAPVTAALTIGNAAPGAPVLVLDTPAPTVRDAATVRVLTEASDPEGDPLRLEWSWTVDGKPLGGAGRTTLQPGEAKKGALVVVEALALDSEGARGAPARLEFQIRNSAPGVPTIALDPARPSARTGARITVKSKGEDVDGDELVTRTRWWRNGVEVPEAEGLKRGERWEAEVRAFDGLFEGPPARVSFVVGNIEPPAPLVSLEPVQPTVLSGLVCTVRPQADPDGDPLTIEYEWSRDGVVQALGPVPEKVEGARLRAGERWSCAARVFDGEAASPVARAEAVVQNAPPLQPKLAVEPEAPQAGRPLRCVVSEPARDPDGERVRYAFAWKSAQGTRKAVEELAGPEVAKDHEWACESEISDGKATVSAVSEKVRVGNTPPRAPRVRLSPAVPMAGRELNCEIAQPAVDPDGDKLEYVFVWLRNGQRQSFAATSTAVPARLVKAGESWMCMVTARDGSSESPAARSRELLVGDGKDK